MAPNTAYFSETAAAGTTVEIDFGDKTAPKNHAIGYWSIRGLGAPLTMMLCAAKKPFTLFLYDIVEDGSGWTSDYFGAKREYIKKYNSPLWNLPFCVDRTNERYSNDTRSRAEINQSIDRSITCATSVSYVPEPTSTRSPSAAACSAMSREV